jgi:hypothetical protein
MRRVIFLVLAVLCIAMMTYGVTHYELQETRANGAII